MRLMHLSNQGRKRWTLTYWAEKKTVQETRARRGAAWQVKSDTALNLDGWRPVCVCVGESGILHKLGTWLDGRGLFWGEIAEVDMDF